MNRVVEVVIGSANVLLVLGTLFVLEGCGDDSSPGDTGVAPDAGALLDAMNGMGDVPPDTNASQDGGNDAGSEPMDSGAGMDVDVPFDAGLPDAGCMDCPSLSPSNSSAFGVLDRTGQVIGAPSGSFDTDRCDPSAGLGACELVARAGLPNVCVCRMDELTIADLRVVGSAGLAILAYESVEILGTLNLSADEAVNGPGGGDGYDGPVMSLQGGAGGSFGGAGGNMSATEMGDATIIPLLGGMRGQDSCNSRPGGGSGGALQISAGAEIVVSGSILAGGGGGGGGGGGRGECLGGAGGGSGGAILLEAASVEVTGHIGAMGGGGGGGGNNDGISGAAGEDGDTENAAGGAATDVFCTVGGGRAIGGDGGGGGATSDGEDGEDPALASCISGNFLVGGGGGGGSVGRIRVNTETGCRCSGTFAPSASFGDVLPRP